MNTLIERYFDAKDWWLEHCKYGLLPPGDPCRMAWEHVGNLVADLRVLIFSVVTGRV